jgi:hypothetical protein
MKRWTAAPIVSLRLPLPFGVMQLLLFRMDLDATDPPSILIHCRNNARCAESLLS